MAPSEPAALLGRAPRAGSAGAGRRSSAQLECARASGRTLAAAAAGIARDAGRDADTVAEEHPQPERRARAAGGAASTAGRKGRTAAARQRCLAEAFAGEAYVDSAAVRHGARSGAGGCRRAGDARAPRIDASTQCEGGAVGVDARRLAGAAPGAGAAARRVRRADAGSNAGGETLAPDARELLGPALSAWSAIAVAAWKRVAARGREAGRRGARGRGGHGAAGRTAGVAAWRDSRIRPAHRIRSVRPAAQRPADGPPAQRRPHGA